MIIDTVTLKDLDEIYNLERKSFKKDAFSKDLILNLIIKNTFFFKLIDDEISNEIIGFIIIVQDREDRVNLINLLIRKNNHNKGWGSYLLNYTMKKVKEMPNIKTIVLNVNSQNKTAIKLYQKFNFRVIQKIENYYRQKESAYLMILNI
ncbi:MAG: GNAT family N-acetyltransferase [Candidatus Lokiarchaeota archaeon]|nr:GNAT family N-acetyltransferase [Candidatus Lokiarchaeota archaeon]